MEGMTPQEIISLITVVISAVLAVAGFVVGRLTGREAVGKEAGALASDIGYVKSGVDDIKRRQEKQDGKVEELRLETNVRLSKVESSAKSAHQRIDRLEDIQPRP